MRSFPIPTPKSQAIQRAKLEKKVFFLGGFFCPIKLIGHYLSAYILKLYKIINYRYKYV